MMSYVPLFLLFALAALLAVVIFCVGPLLGTRNMTAEKQLPFECGSDSTGARHMRLSVKFYFTAILFVIFDVEAVFIYPWTIQFRAVGWGGIVAMLTFLGTLALALVYVWKKGALEWEK